MRRHGGKPYPPLTKAEVREFWKGYLMMIAFFGIMQFIFLTVLFLLA